MEDKALSGAVGKFLADKTILNRDELVVNSNVSQKNFIKPRYDLHNAEKTGMDEYTFVTSETINEVGRCNKRLLSDMTVRLVGNPGGTDTWEYGYAILKPGKYILNGCPAGGSASTYSLQITKSDKTTVLAEDTGEGVEFTVPSWDKYWVYIVANGFDTIDLLFKPMVRDARIQDSTFVPYGTTAYDAARDINAISLKLREVGDESSASASAITALTNVYGGKNLLENHNTTKTITGITFTVNSDGSVTANGTATANTYYRYSNENDINPHWLDPGKYILTGCPSGGSASTYCQFIRRVDNTGTTVSDTGNGGILTVGEGADYMEMIAIYQGQTVSNLTFYPMLRDARITDSTYVPYAMTNKQLTDEKVGYDVYREMGSKNFACPNIPSATINGVTFIVNEDGTVTVDGTATEVATFYYRQNDIAPVEGLEHGKSYILSGCPDGGSNSTYFLYITQVPNYMDYGEGVRFTYDKSRTRGIGIRVGKNVTVSNLVFKPMIRLASDPDNTYVPYAMTNRQLTEKVNGYENIQLTGSAKLETLNKVCVRSGNICNFLVQFNLAEGQTTATDEILINGIPAFYRGGDTMNHVRFPIYEKSNVLQTAFAYVDTGGVLRINAYPQLSHLASGHYSISGTYICK